MRQEIVVAQQPGVLSIQRHQSNGTASSNHPATMDLECRRLSCAQEWRQPPHIQLVALEFAEDPNFAAYRA